MAILEFIGEIFVRIFINGILAFMGRNYEWLTSARKTESYKEFVFKKPFSKKTDGYELEWNALVGMLILGFVIVIGLIYFLN